LPPTAHLNLVSGVYVFNNSLFVADIGDNRVLIWSKFPESELDEARHCSRTARLYKSIPY